MDTDGYPTRAELRKIERWPVTDFAGWMAYIRERWAYGDAGYWSVSTRGRYYLSTAGWSGNEDIITAMGKN